MDKLEQAWERISLRTKLTSLTVAIIGILLAVSSLGTMTLLRGYLQQNIDTLLTTTASTLSHEDPALLDQRLATRQVELPRLPSDYYIGYLDTNANLLVGVVSSTRSSQDSPALSRFNSAFVLTSHGVPFDAPGSSPKQGIKSWRVVTVPLTTMAGSLVVALPTDSNDEILEQYRGIGLSTGLLLLLLSGLAIWMTITSAFKPLREVERTAAAVAAGDTGQRLLEHPGETEIARINRSLNTMLDSIDSSLKSRNQTLDQMRRFVADASHELRTPLVSVRGYAELYRIGALKKKADITDAMERIESEAIRMSGLVESLLALARLDENTELERHHVELVELARIAAKDASVADGSRKIVLTDLDGRELSAEASFVVSANAPQLRQVLTNLLANACRFSPANAQIEVALGRTTDTQILEVRDHGEGIPKELRARVFERFFRADNSRNRETGGSGLGLSIVSTIISRHGGKIVADETVGGGATFRVTLPLNTNLD
jgi:two-component system OmpR family sensor kinase